MSHRPDPLAALSVPDGTTVEEHDIVVEADVIVGGQSTVELGVRAKNVIAGERAAFGGHVEASGDCRLDMWCEVDGNVLVGGDAYLGARTAVGGQLVVAGDLDIGDDVTIEEGFEANGWIEIRNPMSTMVLLFIYLTHLLRVGEDDAAREVVSEVFDEAAESDPLVIPEGATVGDDAWRVSTPARVGDDCRLHGNLRAAEIQVGERNEIFGSLRARGPISVGEETRVHGDVTTRGGEVRIAPGAHVRGDVACEDLQFHEDAVIEGSIRARGEMSITRGSRTIDADHRDASSDQDMEDGVSDRDVSGRDGDDERAAREESTGDNEHDDPSENAKPDAESESTTREPVEDRPEPTETTDGVASDAAAEHGQSTGNDGDSGDDDSETTEDERDRVDETHEVDRTDETERTGRIDEANDGSETDETDTDSRVIEPDETATNGSKPSFGTDQ